MSKNVHNLYLVCIGTTGGESDSKGKSGGQNEVRLTYRQHQIVYESALDMCYLLIIDVLLRHFLLLGRIHSRCGGWRFEYQTWWRWSSYHQFLF
jgi:hypothetical protein